MEKIVLDDQPPVSQFQFKGLSSPHYSRDRCTLGQTILHFNDITTLHVRRVGSDDLHEVVLANSPQEDETCFEETRWTDLGCWQFPSPLSTPSSILAGANGIFRSDKNENFLTKCALAVARSDNEASYFVVAEDASEVCYADSDQEQYMFNASERVACDASQSIYKVYKLSRKGDVKHSP